MSFKKVFPFLLVLIYFGLNANGQVPISTKLSLNGRYDFLMFGTTNNLEGNSTTSTFDCDSSNVSSSTATFTLPNTATGVKKAILYWSGSGDGDFNIKLSGPNGLNELSIDSETSYRDYKSVLSGPQPYFSASYDVTQLLIKHGQGDYTVSELNADTGPSYCNPTVYSGWVIVIIYEDPSLPLNTVKLYDGFQGISSTTISFNLNNLEITKPNGAKLGFVVWEGDNLAHLGYEGMKVNDNELMNSINPPGQLYNSTNSYTNSTVNFNMDIDYFDISPFINADDTEIKITATAGNDIIFFNIYAITINNELPDATVQIQTTSNTCNTRNLDVDYTVFNNPANDNLIKDIDVSFYANATGGILLGTQKVPVELQLGDSITQHITLTIPTGLANEFDLFVVVDDGNMAVELNEDNNVFQETISLATSYFSVDNQGICEGDTLFWGNQTFTTPISQDFYFTSIYGCDSTIHLDLTVQRRLTIDVDTSICKGQSLVLPDGTIINEQGVYSVDLINQYGCDSTVNIHLDIKNNDYFASVSGKEFVKLGYSTSLSLVTNFTPDSIQWFSTESLSCDSCTQTLIMPLNNTTYSVWAFDDLGCILKESYEIRVFKKEEIFVPNIFSPNGDGFNDVLSIFTDKDVKEILKFQVFDRWGILVYDGKKSIDGQQFTWDGTFRNKQLPPDVYIYQIVALFQDDNRKLFGGNVTIIR